MTTPLTFTDADGHRWQVLVESQLGQGSYYCKRATLDDITQAAEAQGYRLVSAEDWDGITQELESLSDNHLALRALIDAHLEFEGETGREDAPTHEDAVIQTGERLRTAERELAQYKVAVETRNRIVAKLESEKADLAARHEADVATAERERDEARAELERVKAERDGAAKEADASFSKLGEYRSSEGLGSPWLPTVERIASGAIATAGQSREMAQALVARELERDAYLAANKELRVSLEKHSAVVEAAREVSDAVDEYQGEDDELFQLIREKCEARRVAVALEELQCALASAGSSQPDPRDAELSRLRAVVEAATPFAQFNDEHAGMAGYELVACRVSAGDVRALRNALASAGSEPKRASRERAPAITVDGVKIYTDPMLRQHGCLMSSAPPTEEPAKPWVIYKVAGGVGRLWFRRDKWETESAVRWSIDPAHALTFPTRAEAEMFAREYMPELEGEVMFARVTAPTTEEPAPKQGEGWPDGTRQTHLEQAAKLLLEIEENWRKIEDCNGPFYDAVTSWRHAERSGTQRNAPAGVPVDRVKALEGRLYDLALVGGETREARLAYLEASEMAGELIETAKPDTGGGG